MEYQKAQEAFDLAADQRREEAHEPKTLREVMERERAKQLPAPTPTPSPTKDLGPSRGR